MPIPGHRQPLLVVGADLCISCDVFGPSEGEEVLRDCALMLLGFGSDAPELSWGRSNGKVAHSVILSDGQAALVGAGVRHSLKGKHKAALTAFYISRDLLRAMKLKLPRGVQVRGLTAAAKLDRYVRDLVPLFRTVCESVGPRSETLLLSAGRELACRLLRFFAANGQSSGRRDKLSDEKEKIVMDHLNQHLNRAILVGEMARLVNMSEPHFSRCFRNKIGVSPAHYHMHLRMKKADELLRTTDEMVRSIAWKLGFRDAGNFNRMFKNHRGWPPSTVRGSNQPRTG